MPYQIPTLGELISQTQQDVAQRLPGALPAQDSLLGAMAMAQAGLSALEHEHLGWIARQIIPSDADESELLKHCAFWGVVRKQAARASGPVRLSLYDAASVPVGTRLQRADGALYRLTDAAEGKAGSVTVNVEADQPGLAGDCGAGQSLGFVTPVAGVAQQALTEAPGIRGGADRERVEELLSRLLYRVQFPPGGGTRWDYERWAREVPGVTRSWCLPTWNGAGTVGVTFVMDHHPDIFPGPTDIARVTDYLARHRDPATGEWVGQPEGPTVTVFAPGAKKVDITLRIAPNTPDNQARIREALRQLFYTAAKPGETLLPSAFWRVLSGISGLDDYALKNPLTPVSSGKTELLVMGDITWL
ncbi:baseplate J/gp47 family protein [Arsenophonus sp. PmNCSU2021_1]|uniref:baseplate J/gp47 family protein n=1 Tax=Arsenophonus sp. PmNCSU2021_1 TaxID=3118989 RepID=UPI002FF3E044